MSAANHTHRTINLLIQLQELHVARVQKRATQPNSRLKQLNDTIDSLMGEIPVEYANQFKLLLGRDTMAIVPLADSSCSACSMALPIGRVNEIRSAEMIYACESCARLLYFPAGLPKGVPQKRSDIPKMGIARFSHPELMIPRLEGKTAEEVLGEIAELMEETGYIDDAAKLTEEALKREALMSTGVDNAIAFPHVRGVEGGGLTLTLGISKRGIKFGGPGGKLTRIFFFVTIPMVTSGFYIKLLAGLCNAFDDKATRDLLMKQDDPDALWEILVKVTKNTIK